MKNRLINANSDVQILLPDTSVVKIYINTFVDKTNVLKPFANNIGFICIAFFFSNLYLYLNYLAYYRRIQP